MNSEKNNRTAGEAGWRQSRYNLIAPIPGTDRAAIANLLRGTCAAYTPVELFLLSEAETLAEDHPILERFKRRGLIVNFDELEALKAMGRGACAGRRTVSLTICPTMGCNFDCSYCFETHTPGFMTGKVQEEVAALAGRMLDAAGAERLFVTWFGGEPLLAVGVIERLSEKLMALAAQRNAKYSAEIITNGYLLTQPIADLLERCGVNGAQITLDGLGAAHDATRHLAGGGPTFERITANLRELKLPFPVRLRHNVHAGNRDEMDALKAFAEKLEKESGNQLRYDPALVSGNDAADKRGAQPQLLCGPDAGDVGIRRSAERFRAGRGHYCGAQWLYSVGIDAQGRLYKCWEDVDKPERSFGTAARWDPKDPVSTADAPDSLIRYLNSAMPLDDAECLACQWLPMCAGGCPNKRLNHKGKECLPFKEQPDRYVLALYARIGQAKRDEIMNEKAVINVLAEDYPQLYLDPDRDELEIYRSVVLRGEEPETRSLAHYRGSESDRMETVDTPAGPVRVVTLGDRRDFELAVRGLMAAKNGPTAPVPASQGAAMLTVFNWPRIRAHLAAFPEEERSAEFKRFTAVKENYIDMLVVLSRGPYSGVSAAAMGLTESEWLADSDTIRRCHELTHVICRRAYPEDVDPVRDELIADTVGLYAAYGRFDPEIEKRFLGIRDGRYVGGRLENYTDEPDKLAGQVSDALDRFKQVIDAQSGAEPFALIGALMGKHDHLKGEHTMEKDIELTKEQLGEVAGGGKDDDGGKGGVICPQCKVENHPAHTVIRDERRFTCWRCGYSKELTDEEVDRILSGQGLS